MSCHGAHIIRGGGRGPRHAGMSADLTWPEQEQRLEPHRRRRRRRSRSRSRSLLVVVLSVPCWGKLQMHCPPVLCVPKENGREFEGKQAAAAATAVHRGSCCPVCARAPRFRRARQNRSRTGRQRVHRCRKPAAARPALSTSGATAAALPCVCLCLMLPSPLLWSLDWRRLPTTLRPSVVVRSLIWKRLHHPLDHSAAAAMMPAESRGLEEGGRGVSDSSVDRSLEGSMSLWCG